MFRASYAPKLLRRFRDLHEAISAIFIDFIRFWAISAQVRSLNTPVYRFLGWYGTLNEEYTRSA
jgi:ABC-type uncharacterized transport system permease subunit